MSLSEIEITRAIVEGFYREIMDSLELDAAVVGAGPSGLTCAYYLAGMGYKVNVFERDLHVGGGIWGGGMMFPRIVVQKEAAEVPRELGLELEPWGDEYLVGDSVRAVARFTSAALDAGARIWIGISVEDVIIREADRIAGVVLNWRAVELAGLHVDPLAVRAKVVVDATGHECDVSSRVAAKLPARSLATGTGGVPGEKPMWSEVAEREIVENTREVYPGLLVTGMAANAAYGSPRMGAVFGGMFMSGKKAAGLAAEIIDGKGG